MRVTEPETAAMQRRNRRRQTEAQSGSGLAAARLEPDKPFDRMLAVGRRYSGAMVDNAEQHLITVALRLDQDIPARPGHRVSAERLRRRPGPAVFDGILN